MKLQRFWLLGFSALLLTPFLTVDSFSAAGGGLDISLNKESYAAGETITVTGSVPSGNISPITLMILAPNGNIVTVAQLSADSDNSFSKDIPTSISNPTWKETGTYIIQVTHLSTTTQLQFSYGETMSAQTKSPDAESPGVSASGTQLTPVDEFSGATNVIVIEDNNVFYQITGGKILKIIPDVEAKSLIIEIETFSDGELIITIPKQVLDTNEGDFFVLVDDEETNHDSASTNDVWTLVIPFYHGSEVIEIIGTFVIPEFGAIAAIILAVAITSIIVLSAKTKLSIMPKL